MKKESVKIVGTGFVSSGDYESIKITGSSNSTGDIKSEGVKVNGEVSFNGNLEFNTFKVNGTASIKGYLKADTVKVNGELTIDCDCDINNLVINGEVISNYNIKCNNVMVRGGLKIKKDLYVNDMNIQGSLKSRGNIEGENITIYGQINCEGLLNAENIYIHPRGISYCREIGATNIEVTRQSKNKLFNMMMYFSTRGTLDCDLIEGDNIKLEYAKVKSIRGKDIDLINKCYVGNLEYINNITISKNSNVNKTIKL